MKTIKTRGRQRHTDGLLAISVARDIRGQQLARAFVMARSRGYRLCVNHIDGVLVNSSKPDGSTIMVDVIDGIVRKSWLT